MARFDDVDLGGDETMQRMVKAEQEKEKATWNSAIDAALEKLNESPDPGINYWIEQIRKLKK